MAPDFLSFLQIATRSALWVAGRRKRSNSQDRGLVFTETAIFRACNIHILVSYTSNNDITLPGPAHQQLNGLWSGLSRSCRRGNPELPRWRQRRCVFPVRTP